MNKTFRNLLAISIAILPINLIMIWYRLTQTEAFSTFDMTVYPLLFGGSSIVLILFLTKYLVRESFTEMYNPGEGSVPVDIAVGVGLTAVYFVMFFLERATIYQWFPSGTIDNELVNTMIDLANSTLMLIIWFGPVLWIGVALFEELSRVFLLKCLWNLSENATWHLAAIVLASALIGMVHVYQGTAGVISIGLKSVVVSLYFYKYRRFLPLVISHGLYDGVQLAMFVVQFRQ